jgi:signal transduction histidine kinase
MVEMSGKGKRPSQEQAPAGANGGVAASRAFQRRLLRLRRLSPPVLLFLVAVYQMGPARWVHDRVGESQHFLVEIVAFGLAAGLIGYILPELALRWNEERETSELQALALIGERERMQRAHELSDEAVQSLYAAGVLLRVDGGTPKAVAEKTLDLLNRSHQSLTQAMAYLRNPLPRSDVHEASVNSNDVNLPGG